MKIKEIEERTGLARANIRFYESKGLVHPERQGNNYRDYSEEDVETLRKIILLRRLDMSIEDIQAILNGELALQDAVQQTKQALQERLEQLQGSLELCDIMQEREESIETLSVDTYDELIRQREQQGKKFRDVMGDILEDYQKNYFEKTWGIFSIQGSYTKGAIVSFGFYVLLNWFLYTFYILPQDGLRGGFKNALLMLEAFAIVSAGYMLYSLVKILFSRERRPARIGGLLAFGAVLLAVIAVAVGGMLYQIGAFE